MSLTINDLQFDISLTDPRVEPGARGPKVYKVKLTKVAEINTEYVSQTIVALSFGSNVQSQSPQSLRGWSTVSRQYRVDCDNGETLSALIYCSLSDSLTGFECRHTNGTDAKISVQRSLFLHRP